MKKIISVLMAVLILLGGLPSKYEAADAVFDEQLKTYLKEVSTQRGFEVTKDDLDVVLWMRGKELSEFKSVQELSDYLGPVILADHSNLSDMLTSFEMTFEELEGIMDKNDEVVDDYIYVDDLKETISYYSMTPEERLAEEFDEEFFIMLLKELETEIDFQKDEQERVKKHFEALEEKLSSEETIGKLEALAEEMQQIEEFQTLDELSPESAAKVMSIFNEFLNIFELKLDFTLVKGKTEEKVSFLDLLYMTELVNASVKVDIYNLSGDFLADIILTGDMIDSEVIEEIGQDLDTVTDKVNEVKTENGGKLPNTAGNYLSEMLLGLILLMVALFAGRYVRRLS